jgi:hypothetical protein
MLHGNNLILRDLAFPNKKLVSNINGVQAKNNIRVYRNIECNPKMTGYVKILSGWI